MDLMGRRCCCLRVAAAVLLLWCWAAAAAIVLSCCCRAGAAMLLPCFYCSNFVKNMYLYYDLDFVKVLLSFCRDFIINFLELYKWILLKYCCRFVEISPVNHPIHPFHPVTNGWIRVEMDGSGGVGGCGWRSTRPEPDPFTSLGTSW